MISTTDSGPGHDVMRITAADQPRASDMAARRHQAFPVLAAQQIGQLLPFGAQRQWHERERLLGAGKPGPGMFVVPRGEGAVVVAHVHSNLSAQAASAWPEPRA